MTQYINKADVVAEIEKLYNLEYDNTSDLSCGKKIILRNILLFLDTIEVKEVKEEPMNNDLEDYAKKESESFAEREYEIDCIDRNALAKGYYWGVKAGAQWQALHSLETIKGMEEQAFLAGVEAEQINKSFSKEELEELLNRRINKL